MPYSPPGSQGRALDQIRVIERGRDCTVWSTDGTEYLDGVSALEAMILGHSAGDVVEAVHDQAQRVSFIDLFRFTSRPAVELAAELCALAPGMQYAFFTPGGAEADEVAIKLARQYHHLRGEPHRMKVITREGAFHGCTQGAMSLDGLYFASHNVIYDGGLTWGRTAPAPACFRCDFGKSSVHLTCVHAIEATIRAEGPETIAAVVVDPMATAIAVAAPPDQYLVDLREVCDRYGVLLVIDEVITGMGRTGRLFCAEYSGVQADFITMSKGLSSGYVPIGATLVAPHISDVFRGRMSGTFLHGHTYGGHPLAAAAALQVVRRVTRERLWETAEAQGERLLSGLRSLAGHRYYWDVRGRGLLAGLEIVRDRDLGRRFPDPVAAGNRLRVLCREFGLISLILHPGNVLFLAPAFVVRDHEIDRMVDIVDRALTVMETEDIDYGSSIRGSETRRMEGEQST